MVSGERTAIVLLHSSASSARQWDALAQSLAPHADVHAIDLHGHGARSEWNGPRPITLADEAALALPILERARRVHLIGHSYGGAVALKLASLHPQRVASVAVYEPVLFRLLFDHHGGTPAAREVMATAQAVDEQVARGRPTAAARCFVDFWSGPGAWGALSERSQAAVAARMASVARQFHALFGEAALTARLASLATPLLVLGGERTPAATRLIAGLLRVLRPDAQHETLPGMGHMGPLTHAAEVNRRLLQFLGRPEGARPAQTAPPGRASSSRGFIQSCVR